MTSRKSTGYYKCQPKSDITSISYFQKCFDGLNKTVRSPESENIKTTNLENSLPKKKRMKRIWDFRKFGMNDYDIIPCSSSSVSSPSSVIDENMKDKCENNKPKSQYSFPSILPLKRKSDDEFLITNVKRQKLSEQENILNDGLRNDVTENNLLPEYDENSSIFDCSFKTSQNISELIDEPFVQTPNSKEGETANAVETISGPSEKDSFVQSENSYSPTSGTQKKTLDTPLDNSCSTKSPETVLKGITTYVEVRNEFEDISDAVAMQLIRLGATVSKTLNKKVTHVVFKDGRPSTQKKALSQGAHMVSVLWVHMCKEQNEKIEESLYPSRLKESPESLLFPKKRFRCMTPRDPKQELAASAEMLKKLINRVKSIGSETPVLNLDDGNAKENGKLDKWDDYTTPGRMKKLSPIQKRNLFGASESSPNANDHEMNSDQTNTTEKTSGESKSGKKRSSGRKGLVHLVPKSKRKKTTVKHSLSQASSNKPNTMLIERVLG